MTVALFRARAKTVTRARKKREQVNDLFTKLDRAPRAALLVDREAG